MTLAALAKRFVELCNQGKNFDVMETMYAPGIVSVEASGKEVVGQGPVIEKSKQWAAGLTLHGEQVLGPYFSDAANAATRDSGQFAVHFTFEVTPKATGRRVRQQEVALYTVEHGKITREQFFYEGTW